ncbi:MAG TPA: TAT-variant-translocated molybdopterin oxidoreductase, partial [Pyrinomonadaceae bacterium]|nr:TAT-variant-translocated molybdopterin oxidoreductase [Pyrinomonadaceae bacterium]
MTERHEQSENSSTHTRLNDVTTCRYWRSLEELSQPDELEEIVKRESPRHAALLENALDRRQFLKLMAASLALAGLTACGARQPVEEIIPYVRQPEDEVLG